MIALDFLQAEFAELCSRIDPTLITYRFPTQRTDDGSAHVEFVAGVFHYIVTERGLELSRQTTTDKDELLYWLVSSVAAARASAYEFRHRIKGQSFRRLMFAKELEFLGRVRADWAIRRAQAIEATLTIYPYDDTAEG